MEKESDELQPDARRNFGATAMLFLYILPFVWLIALIILPEELQFITHFFLLMFFLCLIIVMAIIWDGYFINPSDDMKEYQRLEWQLKVWNSKIYDAGGYDSDNTPEEYREKYDELKKRKRELEDRMGLTELYKRRR